MPNKRRTIAPLSVGTSQLIRGYQWFISPLLPRACRFMPSCSEYARQAVLSCGLVQGLWLAARRLSRCHPFHSGGYDPPPNRTGWVRPR